MNLKKKNLIEVIAYICYTATEHTNGWEEGLEGSLPKIDWEKYFQCTSFTVSCLLCKNTKLGLDGVESDIMLDILCERPVKDLEEWQVIAEAVVNYFNYNIDTPFSEYMEIVMKDYVPA